MSEPLTDRTNSPGTGLRGRLAVGIALLVLMAVAFLLRLIPIRMILAPCGSSLGPVGCIPLASLHEEARARAIRKALAGAVALTPWRADCLPQAITASLLCRWRNVPAALHLGMRLDGQSPLEAHAWVCAGRVTLCGGQAFGTYTPVACFQHHGRKAKV